MFAQCNTCGFFFHGFCVISLIPILITVMPCNKLDSLKIPSLVPRPSHPSVFACSTNTGEGLLELITCSDVPGCWVDCGGVAHSQNNHK